MLEGVAPPDQRPGSERCVHLVGREGHVVETGRVVERADLDAAMRRKLSAVHQDLRARRVRLLCQPVNIGHAARHVGTAGHGDQLDVARVLRQQAVEVGLVKSTECVRSDVLDAGTRPPGEIVAVVVEQRHQHHVVAL